jgi:hypothetical protein
MERAQFLNRSDLWRIAPRRREWKPCGIAENVDVAIARA